MKFLNQKNRKVRIFYFFHHNICSPEANKYKMMIIAKSFKTTGIQFLSYTSISYFRAPDWRLSIFDYGFEIFESKVHSLIDTVE